MSGDCKIGLREFDKVLRLALAQTYSSNPQFDNESDFKYELFHQLHALETNGRKLGDMLPGCPTSMLHAEARPQNGVNQKADLLICNPATRKVYNYRAEVVIELKKALNERSLRRELEKFSAYSHVVRKLYIISANRSSLGREQANRVIEGQKPPNAKVEVFGRATILDADQSSVSRSLARRKSSGRTRTALAEHVARCVRATLNLYGNNRHRYHGFFWRNYEPDNEGDWTFPSEGDFNAQLFHRLRSNLKQKAIVRTEYRPPSIPSRSRVDLFVDGGDETVGVEVKMNMLVFIQGEDAYRGNNKSDTLARLRGTGSKFSVMYYDERANEPWGPVPIAEMKW